MRIEEALQNLNLNEKEAAVYVALVKLDQAVVVKIAEKSGLKRPTVYVVLEELRKKGLVLKTPHSKKQIFTAKDPRELIEDAENKIFVAKSILPQLLAMAGGEKKPKVLYFEGIKEIREFLWYKLGEMSGKTFLGFYGNAENCPKELLNLFLGEYQDELDRKNVSIRGIAPLHSSLEEVRKQDIEHNRTIKQVLFSKYSSGMQIDIGETFIRILSFQDLQGVIIENKHIAKAVKQIFELIWEREDL